MNRLPKMIIAGGSGLFGNYLTEFFKAHYKVIILSRGAPEVREDGVVVIHWDGQSLGDWQNELEGAQVLINLSGKSINCRFTTENRKKLVSSRVDTTQVLAQAISTLEQPPKVWLNASAGSMYVPSDMANTENDPSANEGFLSDMAILWEKAFFEKDLPRTRRVAMRISLLLGNQGGVFPVWKKITQLFLGGKAGTGKQMVSWMHIQDAARAVSFIINSKLEGPINFSSNHPISNANLMKTLRQKIGVAFGIPAPALAIKLASPIIGVEPTLLLDSVNFVSKKLNNADFKFKYSTFNDVCENLVNG